MAKQAKMSVLDLMHSRDELLKCQLAASMSRRNIPPRIVDKILTEAFRKEQKNYIKYSKKSRNNLAEILRHEFTLIPKP